MDKIIYPIGVQNFEKLINGGYIYVDKTEYVRTLVEMGSSYFLSRPRRFGKSLLLSTLHAFFEGKRELFKGLAIDSWKEWLWDSYPVIHLDLNAKDYTYKESLFERLNEHLEKYESDYGISEIANSLDERFRKIIVTAYEKTGKQVVVLIDEYDKPILDTLHDDRIKEMHRDTLRAFYATLKSVDEHLMFCFLTGVTKFGQLNVFSGLNNLKDISLSNDYAGICGITEKEIDGYFISAIELCAKEWDCSPAEARDEFKYWYDGYHFSPSTMDVYNPWSTLNAISEQFLAPYWNQTGGGLSFLYKLLEAGKISLAKLDDFQIDVMSLAGNNVDVSDAIPILYQTGYLTIKNYDRKNLMFTLSFPNFEVEAGFMKGLLPAYSGISSANTEFAISEFVDDLRNGNPEEFLKRMHTFFEDFPSEHSLRKEEDFQNIIYCITKLIGLQVEVERHSARGRADMVIKTDNYVYIMEFKVNQSPELAMKQIDAKGYAEPFDMDKRKLIKVGVEFSTETRNITSWAIK